jgi:hypothetical protein
MRASLEEPRPSLGVGEGEALLYRGLDFYLISLDAECTTLGFCSFNRLVDACCFADNVYAYIVLILGVFYYSF